MVQRVLEVEAYRVMALLGLPFAWKVSPEVTAMEAELAGINRTGFETARPASSRNRRAD